MEGVSSPTTLRRRKLRQMEMGKNTSSPSRQKLQRKLGRQLSTLKESSGLAGTRSGRKRKNSSEDVSENANNNLDSNTSAFPGIPLKKRRKNDAPLSSPLASTLSSPPTSPLNPSKEGKKEIASPTASMKRKIRSPRWSMNGFGGSGGGNDLPSSPRSPRWSMSGFGGGGGGGGDFFSSCRRPLSFDQIFKGGEGKREEDKGEKGEHHELDLLEDIEFTLPPSPSPSPPSLPSSPCPSTSSSAPLNPPPPPPTSSPLPRPTSSQPPTSPPPQLPSSPPPCPPSPTSQLSPRGLYLSPSIRDRQLLLSSSFYSPSKMSTPRPLPAEVEEGEKDGESIVQQRRAMFEKLALTYLEEGKTLPRGFITKRTPHPLSHSFYAGPKGRGGEGVEAREEEGEEREREGGEQRAEKVLVSNEVKNALETVFTSVVSRLKENQLPSSPSSPSPPPSPSPPSPPSPSSPPTSLLLDSPTTLRRKRRFCSARKELSETEYSYCNTLSALLNQYHHPLSSLLPERLVISLFVCVCVCVCVCVW